MSKHSFRIFIIFVGIIGLAWGGYLIYSEFRYNPLKVLEREKAKYVEAMTADTYGGKTPQETLNLFVKALRAGDVELAHKYFLLDENLSREKWLVMLEDVKERGLLKKMADDIANEAKPLGGLYEGDFGFGLLNDDGTVGVLIDMELNKYSGVWKIESL